MLASSPAQNSTMEAPNSIQLSVATEDSDCYLVTASGDSFRITVEVRTSVDTGKFRTQLKEYCVTMILFTCMIICWSVHYSRSAETIYLETRSCITNDQTLEA
jgi:hypothetical protein